MTHIYRRDEYMHPPIQPTPEGAALGVALKASIAWAEVCPPPGINNIPDDPRRLSGVTWVDSDLYTGTWGLPVLGTSGTAEEAAWADAVAALAEVVDMSETRETDRLKYAEEHARHNYLFWRFTVQQELERMARRCVRGEGLDRSMLSELMHAFVQHGSLTIEELVEMFMKLHRQAHPDCPYTDEVVVAHIKLYTSD